MAMTVQTPLPRYQSQLRPGVLGSPLVITVLAEILQPKMVEREKQDIAYETFSGDIPISFCPPLWLDQNYLHLLLDSGEDGGGFTARLVAYDPWASAGINELNFNDDDAWFQITAPLMPYRFPVHKNTPGDDSIIFMPLLLPKDRMIQA